MLRAMAWGCARAEWRGAALLALAGIWFVSAQNASAGAFVYASPNPLGLPVRTTSATVTWGDVSVLDIYIANNDASATSSQLLVVCEDGDGDEICGFEVVIQAGAGMTFTGFSPGSSLPGNDVLVFDPDPTPPTFTELRVNATNTSSPGPTPIHIGTLSIDSTFDVTSQVSVAGGRFVDATGALIAVSPQAIVTAVPEPSIWLGLSSGAILLSWLSRRRERLR